MEEPDGEVDDLRSVSEGIHGCRSEEISGREALELILPVHTSDCADGAVSPRKVISDVSI